MPLYRHKDANGFGSPTSDFCALSDGTNVTAVLARIHASRTDDRGNPPACHNGFAVEGLPLARGHVVALSLGGCDESFNIVPQFEHWQATGAWRRMEVHVRKHFDGKLMLVEILYGRDGGEQGFADWAGSTFMAWTDSRVPDHFTINIYDSPASPFAIEDGGAFYRTVNGLQGALYSQEFDLGTEMPSEDKAYYLNLRALEAIEAKLHKDKDQRDPMDYVLQDPNAMGWVRGTVGAWDGVTATEAGALQAFNIVRRGHDITEPKFVKQWNLLHPDDPLQVKRKPAVKRPLDDDGEEEGPKKKRARYDQ